VLSIYLVGAWMALQVVDVLVNNFGLPEWFPAFALGLLVLGLPIVLATAFVQEGAPRVGSGAEGVDDAPPTTDASLGTGEPRAHDGDTGVHALLTWRNAIVGGMAAFSLWGVVAAGWLLFGAGVPEQLGGAGGVPARSVAVLPFANMTGQDDHFTDGIHDDILTHLSRIDDVMVISRTSVLQYRDTEKTVREIGSELGVSSVMEGSVRKAGDRIRVNVQLIDARTDAHLWAEIYDRDLTPENVFAIQSEIARSIAEALQAELSAGEAAELAARPTESMEAYDFYLRGQDYLEDRVSGEEELERAVGMFERAVEADPGFVEAHGQLAYARALLHYQYQPSPTLPAEVLEAVEAAESLDPTHPRARAARGWYRYYVETDYDGALATFRELLEESPSDGPLYRSVGLLQRRLGRFAESIESFERARRLDPRSPIILRALTYTYIHARRYDDAEEALELRSELLPEDEGFNTQFLALARLLATGDAQEARRAIADLLAREPAEVCCENPTLPLYGAAWRALPAEDRRAAMEARAQEAEAEVARGDTVPLYHALRAQIATLDGRDADARAAFEAALGEFEKTVSGRDEWYGDRMVRASLLAGLGRRHEAIAEARAAASDPEAINDHIQARPMTRALLAHMLARFGDEASRDEAMDLLEPMVTGEFGWVSVPALGADPYWDALRDHPRFRRLVGGDAAASAP